MATNPVAPACPICFISFRLAARSSTEAQPLFLDGEGPICADPHWLPREQALLLARNQPVDLGVSRPGDRALSKRGQRA